MCERAGLNLKGLVAVNRTKVLEAAQKFLSKGQYDKAVLEYQKLVQEDPRDVRTLLKIGDLHTRRSKPKEAIDVYERVADLYAKQGFFLKAVAVYKQILKLDPAHLESMQKLAKMYEELSLTSDALSTYELVADAYSAQANMPKALETMQRMIELDGQNVAVRIKHAEALSKAGRASEAAQAFAAGAGLLKDQGRMDDYLRVVERQLYHDPDNVLIARELAGLYLERSDPKRALAKLQICFKADPRDVQTLEMLAEAFRQLGQSAKTVSVLKEIARLHNEAGSDEPRRRTLQRVLELDPNDAEAKQALSAPVATAKVVEPARPTAAPPRMRAPQAPPPPPVAVKGAPPPRPSVEAPLEHGSASFDDADLESSDELDLVEDSESDVLIVDETSGASDRPLRPSVAPALEDPLLALLAEADAREGAGDYEGAVSALQGVLELEPDHTAAHERLKDIYLAADRRVDAVKELLWLSSSCEADNHDRAVHYAEAAFELAPKSEATRRRLTALGIALPGEARVRPTARNAAIEAELDAMLPPVSPYGARAPSHARAPEAAASARRPEPSDDQRTERANLLDLPISPEEFDARPPARKQPYVPRELVSELLERDLSPADFIRGKTVPPRAANAPSQPASARPSARAPDPGSRAEEPRAPDLRSRAEEPRASTPALRPARAPEAALRPRAEGTPARSAGTTPPGGASERPKRRSRPAEVVQDDPPSLEFAPIGTSELSISDAPEAYESVPPAEAYGREFEGHPPTATHEYTLDDQHFDPPLEPTVTGAPRPDLLRAASQPDESQVAPALLGARAEPRASAPSVRPAPASARASERALARASERARKSGAPPRPSRAPQPVLAAEVEEALDEAEFFATQGLLDEALEVVQEAMLIYPASLELKRRFEEYEQKAEQLEAEQARAAEAADDDSFDIAEQLANELVEVDQPAETDEMIDVESVFAQFKRGVAEQVAPDDSDTHFDLGIAYKEMGLIEDAINEFEVAAKSKKRACTALNLVGMCHLERNKPELALQYFQRALDAEGRGPAEELALNYEIGTVYEQMGQLDRALASFELAAARDRTYRGVSAKLDLLKKRGIKPAAVRR